MPKELHVVPNQRIDLADFQYGTRTFTVDSLKDHVHRLFTGDYSGGFVLEGFRVEIENAATRHIIVHNGLAIDREGRLITFEEGSNFKNNSDASTVSVQLSSTDKTYFVYVEFKLADSANEPRSLWDPTFENADIVDVPGGDTHAAKKGKEVVIDLPPRLCHSYSVGVQSNFFPDVSDSNTLRIPVASIVVADGVISTDTERAKTTVIKAPSALHGDTLGDSITKLRCANTRHFPTSGTISVYKQSDGSKITFENSKSSMGYTFNDRYNNTITGISNLQEDSSATGTNEIRTGDMIICSTGPSYITAGSKYDNRPMFFSFTDPTSATQEVDPTGSFSDESRNLRYFSGRALITNPDNTTPATTTFANRTVTHPRNRVENNIKNSQDFFRVLGTLIREMKYGKPFTMTGTVVGVTSTDDTALTHQGKDRLVDTSEFFTEDFVGAVVTFTSGALDTQTTTVSEVIGEHILTFTSSLTTNVTDGFTYKLVKNISTDSQYVDSKKAGTSREIYDARIDKLNRTYQSDLQTKLQANKPFLATIGDGVTSFGDYNVKSGDDIGAVINDFLANDASYQNRKLRNLGGTIYIKRGEYTISSIAKIRENIHIKGDGPENTKITAKEQVGDAYFDIVGTTAKAGSTRHTIPGVKFSDIYLIGRPEGDGDTGGGNDVNAGGRSSIIRANETTAVFNFTLDNVRIKGGSYYTATSGDGTGIGQAKSSAVTLGNSSQETAMRDIKILNSRFEITGRGINFANTARNVKIDNCTFVSEETDGADDIGGNFEFAGMVEGIRFGKASSNGYSYGEGSSKAGGSISVTNCQFMGKQTDQVKERGWIYLSSSLECPSVKISNCSFTGDVLGANGGNGFPKDVQDQDGACVVNNADVSLLIIGCQFHSYGTGIKLSAGDNSIKSCLFEVVKNACLIKDDSISDDYVTLDSVGGQIDSKIIAKIDDCNFVDFPTDTVNGTESFQAITIDSTDSNTSNGSGSYINVVNCTFESYKTGISLSSLGSDISSASEYKLQYSHINIDSCTFKDIKHKAVSMATNGVNTRLHNSITGTTDVLKWGVRRFIYSENKHFLCSAIASSCVDLSGGHVVANNNVFDGGARTVDQNCLYIVGGARSVEINGNSFVGLEGDTSTVDFTAIKFDVPHRNDTGDSTLQSSDHVTVTMNNNKIHCLNKFGAKGKNNGILLAPYTFGYTSSDTPTSVNGTFLNNDFSLHNMQYGILARQDIEVSSSLQDVSTGQTLENATRFRNWEWSTLNCQNNKITSGYESEGLSAFSAQGNDIFATWEKTGGGTETRFMTAGPPPNESPNSGSDDKADIQGYLANFMGFMDMRFCKKGGIATISSNILQITDATVSKTYPFTPPAQEKKDINTVIGIRILRFPGTLNISNNVIDGASLVVKHSWGAGFDTATTESNTGGTGSNNNLLYNKGYGLFKYSGSNQDSRVCRMTITNNDVNCAVQGAAVDISGTPAFITADSKTPEFFPTVLFQGNKVRGELTTTTTYGADKGVVRFWPEYYGADRTTDSLSISTSNARNLSESGWTGRGLEFEIVIRDNFLFDSIFYMDPGEPGAGIRMFSDDEDVDTNNGGIVIQGNTKICKSTAHNKINLLGLDNNTLSGNFGNGPRAGHDWFGDHASAGEDNDGAGAIRPNPPLIIMENTIIITGDKTQRLRIVRGAEAHPTAIQTFTGV